MLNVIDKKLRKVQFISGNTLKIIACVCMFIDHFSKIPMNKYMGELFSLSLSGTISNDQFFSIQDFQRTILFGIGSIAFPLFCFLLVEGFFHTRDRRYYGRRLLLAAAVSEIPYDLAFSGRWMDAQHQNVCLTFFLALVAMELLERYGNGIWEKLVLTAVFCTLTEAAGADGGAWGMGLVLAFYFCVIGNSGTNVPRHILFHEKTAGVFMKMIAAVLIGAFAWQEPLWVLALTAVCLLLYDGYRGRSRFRSFFYIYYPAHLLVLYFLS